MGLLGPNFEKIEKNKDVAGLIGAEDAFCQKCGKK
jgi:hypothetical protein